MRCNEFLCAIDAYVDGELDQAQSVHLIEHARECPLCAEELRKAQALGALLADLDRDMVAPLSAQAAWRGAIRAEVARKRRSGALRTLSALAAAFVLMIGGTLGMRTAGVLDALNSPQESASIYADAIAYSGPSRGEISSGYSIGASLESDGGADADVPPQSISPMSTGAADVRDSLEGLFVRGAIREIYALDYAAVKDSVGDLVAEYGGYIKKDVLTNDGALRVSEMLIAVPREDLDTFLSALDYIGVVTRAEVSTEDVTLNYSDSAGRLESLRLEVEGLNGLIASASDSAELAALASQLEEAYEKIDALESKVRAYDSDIAYARVELTLREGEPAEAALEGEKLTAKMGKGFSYTVGHLKQFFSDMVVSLAVIAPVATIALGAAIAIIAVVVWVKRRGTQGNR